MASSDPARPNILFILSDDHGAWALGCAGNREIRTPELDKLAGEGTHFSNFFCASPVCSPARATLLTGKIPSQHGVHDFLALKNTTLGDASVDDIEYLAGQKAYTEILSAAGYRCGISGKWHLGVASRPQKSFLYWNVFTLGGGPYYRSPMFADGHAYRSLEYVTDLITDNALKFLSGEAANDSPFCMQVHYTAPHSPWEREQHPKELYSDYFDNCAFDSVPDLPLHHDQLHKAPGLQEARSAADRRAILSGYYAAVTAMDRNIGRLVGWLDESGLRENTLVFFCSDNGMSMGHHGIYGKGNATFPPNMYDSTVKIPAIASRPGHVPQGRVDDTLLSQYDFFPTILEYCGQQHREANLPGRSFTSLLKGDADAGRDRIVVYDEYGPTRMIRTREWKYVHRYAFGPHQLFDLRNDPGEISNLVDHVEHRPVVARLRAEMEAWFSRYAERDRDGVYEAVTGRGQVGLVGSAADGYERFPQDLVFTRDLPKPD